MTAYDQWLASLKPGDEVFYPGMYGAGGAIVTVRTLSPVLVTLSNWNHAHRDTGHVAGRLYGRIEPVTDLHRAEAERRQLSAWAAGPDVRNASLNQLRAMKRAFESL
ncbi:hypothetical protein [Ralstonia sp.]|uniref:hypothetical protein n=1 Tax=Ralstonia sp. TaxID=54061 RepID=UPI00257B2915|nr:hypothetical protein [Ralstonia sp.]MBA4203214.1 hypothetical protein [Ralstonia sp.]